MCSDISAVVTKEKEKSVKYDIYKSDSQHSWPAVFTG